MTNGRVIEVAAAVVQREDGSFLLAQRPPDKIWAGYWEFPGGKIEPGESPYHALVRELREELGIETETAHPWITRVFAYPHGTVRLHFFRVTRWRGDPHPHEGQQFSWHWPSGAPRKGMPPAEPILPANGPVLRALELPALYAISNVKELGEPAFLARLKAALANGLRLVQLREKDLSGEAVRALALRMLPIMREHGAKLIVNGDVELAQQIGADGVQLSASQLAALKQRPDVEWCAASCHDAAELQRAEALGCDFAMLSPVLPTQSHPGAPALGWERFGELVQGCAIPVYALGGLQLPDMETAWRHGAHGVALLRQAWPEPSASAPGGGSSSGTR
ncbi:MAG TPA: Nudix family hydrolase [Gallionellaceae bacterium]|nr:Nudix family hydrolase [Gallionellaceae bacterium]